MTSSAWSAPDGKSALPQAGYIICTTPRSGSTMLCRMLAATDRMGVPDSYFRKEDLVEWATEWGIALDSLPGTYTPS
ncbi:MAG: Stf0 family sulfotransferase, partial [Pseudomonadota bacterium]